MQFRFPSPSSPLSRALAAFLSSPYHLAQYSQAAMMTSTPAMPCAFSAVVSWMIESPSDHAATTILGDLLNGSSPNDDDPQDLQENAQSSQESSFWSLPHDNPSKITARGPEGQNHEPPFKRVVCTGPIRPRQMEANKRNSRVHARQPTRAEKEMNKRGIRSDKQYIKEAIRASIKQIRSYPCVNKMQAFSDELTEKGVRVTKAKSGNDITFKRIKTRLKVNGAKLGQGYSKAGLEKGLDLEHGKKSIPRIRAWNRSLDLFPLTNLNEFQVCSLIRQGLKPFLRKVKTKMYECRDIRTSCNEDSFLAATS